MGVRGWVAAAWAAMALAAPAAMAQQGDPLGGQFGALEAAMAPAEAARDITLMADALAKLPPQRPGVVDTYVLSASLWNDPVFENEAREAAGVLGRRYDATDRTLILSAGRGARLQRAYPAATPDNISAALGKIGQLIDPKEDLVVVFVTSHGSPDGAVALREENRLSGALRAQHLRAALQQMGAGAKLVIVSACFSGHFILPFTSPDAVVLTAAAADKTSFGCAPERDWTYFGDALFNHALRGGEGVLSAFGEARDLIGKWEGKLHDEWAAKPVAQRGREQEPQPSNPQSAVGDMALEVIGEAESYGLSVACSAHLSFALDRAKSGRPLKGLADAAALDRTLTATQARAVAEGQKRGRSPQDTAKAVAAASATALQLYAAQTDVVVKHAAGCLAP